MFFSGSENQMWVLFVSEIWQINLTFNHHNIDIFDDIFPNKQSTIIDFQNFENPVKDKLSAHFSRYTFSYNTVCFKLENIVSTLDIANDFPSFSETHKFFLWKVCVSRMYSCVKIHSKSYLSRCRSLRLSGVIMRDSIWWNTTRSCHKHYLRKTWLTLSHTFT